MSVALKRELDESQRIISLWPMSITASISCNILRGKGPTHSLLERQTGGLALSFLRPAGGLCWVEIPNEEFPADIPRGASNLYVPSFRRKRQITDSSDLLGSYCGGIFTSITGKMTVPSWEVCPRPMYYRQKRATSWPGDCDAFKLSRVAGQCGAGQQFVSGLMVVSCLPHLG